MSKRPTHAERHYTSSFQYSHYMPIFLLLQLSPIRWCDSRATYSRRLRCVTLSLLSHSKCSRRSFIFVHPSLSLFRIGPPDRVASQLLLSCSSVSGHLAQRMQTATSHPITPNAAGAVVSHHQPSSLAGSLWNLMSSSLNATVSATGAQPPTPSSSSQGALDEQRSSGGVTATQDTPVDPSRDGGQGSSGPSWHGAAVRHGGEPPTDVIGEDGDTVESLVRLVRVLRGEDVLDALHERISLMGQLVADELSTTPDGMGEGSQAFEGGTRRSLESQLFRINKVAMDNVREASRRARQEMETVDDLVASAAERVRRFAAAFEPARRLEDRANYLSTQARPFSLSGEGLSPESRAAALAQIAAAAKQVHELQTVATKPSGAGGGVSPRFAAPYPTEAAGTGGASFETSSTSAVVVACEVLVADVRHRLIDILGSTLRVLRGLCAHLVAGHATLSAAERASVNELNGIAGQWGMSAVTLAVGNHQTPPPPRRGEGGHLGPPNHGGGEPGPPARSVPRRTPSGVPATPSAGWLPPSSPHVAKRGREAPAMAARQPQAPAAAAPPVHPHQQGASPGTGEMDTDVIKDDEDDDDEHPTTVTAAARSLNLGNLFGLL